MDKRLIWLAVKLNGNKAYIGATGKLIAGLFLVVVGMVLLFQDGDLEVVSTLTLGGLYCISSGVEGIGQRHATEKATRSAAMEGGDSEYRQG